MEISDITFLPMEGYMDEDNNYLSLFDIYQ